MQTDTNKATSWLWPDRTIGKRESRDLREEHNALVNSHAELVDLIRDINTRMAKALPLTWPRAFQTLKIRIDDAIAAATD